MDARGVECTPASCAPVAVPNEASGPAAPEASAEDPSVDPFCAANVPAAEARAKDLAASGPSMAGGRNGNLVEVRLGAAAPGQGTCLAAAAPIEFAEAHGVDSASLMASSPSASDCHSESLSALIMGQL